jgi:CPA1 family monovalent cation:H+ antiporter
MNGALSVDLAVIFFAILVLVSVANRIGVAYPILLVLGGIALGFVPGLPPLAMPPELVLTIFLPPLLYWESVTAPTSEFFSGSGLWWIFQLAFGLVIVTMLAVAAVAHVMIPAMAWGPALVLGAIVSSTDEVAFAPIIARIPLPRHVIATIEGESLVNDATSLVLYAIGITAIVSGTFSFTGAFAELAISVVGAIAIGGAAALSCVAVWRFTKDDALQAMVSLMAPYLAYLPAQHFHASGVLAVVTAGLIVSYYTPRVLTPSTRERGRGFWITAVFMANAFIFVLVGMQFHSILSALQRFHPLQLIGYGVAISATAIVVRLVWVFAQALIPATNEPEHTEGKADWSHVAVLAWAGMRGGISLAAALAIPLEAAARPFPDRDLIIFLTFCVLLATLIGQGGTLPFLLRWMKVVDDGTDEREERIALAATAKAALKRLDELSKSGDVPQEICEVLRRRFRRRWTEFGLDAETEDGAAARFGTRIRELESDLVDAQRTALLRLRREGKVDNTVMRRVQRLLDLQSEETELLSSTGHSDIATEP